VYRRSIEELLFDKAFFSAHENQPKNQLFPQDLEGYI
jgi:hypothetical protein